jgi:hypothetical protein
MLLGDPAVHSAISGESGVVCLKLTRANKDLYVPVLPPLATPNCAFCFALLLISAFVRLSCSFSKEYKATDAKLFSFFGKGFDRTISSLKFLRGLSADPRFLLFHVAFRLTTVEKACHLLSVVQSCYLLPFLTFVSVDFFSLLTGWSVVRTK